MRPNLVKSRLCDLCVLRVIVGLFFVLEAGMAQDQVSAGVSHVYRVGKREFTDGEVDKVRREVV